MFAMTPGTGRKQNVKDAAPRIVVPRLLRRPVRMTRRLLAGEASLPRYPFQLAMALLFAATGIYGMVLGAHTPAVVKSITAASGFAIDDVRISGQSETSEIDILGQLGLDGGTSLIGFDSVAARDRIAELPWVGSASVRKIYPDRVQITITERKAYAIWQHGSRLSLVDKAGEPITDFQDGKFARLPLVVGYGAAQKAAAILDEVERFPKIAARAKGYIRVADRRWDIRLENGLTLRLPEHGSEAALLQILELDRKHGLLSRDVTVVDLRVPDRLVLKLSPQAVTHRNAAMKQRMESVSGKGKRI